MNQLEYVYIKVEMVKILCVMDIKKFFFFGSIYLMGVDWWDFEFYGVKDGLKF